MQTAATGTAGSVIGANLSQRFRVNNLGQILSGDNLTALQDPAASAVMDLNSITKGFLPPRMSGAQAEAISAPAEGLLIYANNGNGTTITSTGWWGYNGSAWVKLN